ncbi:5-methylcytosine-specific restriction endonuclease McrA [Rhizobium sp. BE258]|nr:5-methylcytosine-specific restriction endonuclease McrA [Rhizobium sp. BE258]
MPTRAPRICSCGKTVPSGALCACQEMRAKQRKARFDAKRPSARERGYDAEWQRESRSFLSVYNSCRRCGQRATLVDHIKPHRGDKILFWDRSNWQALCVPCHSSWKQSQERRPNKETSK